MRVLLQYIQVDYFSIHLRGNKLKLMNRQDMGFAGGRLQPFGK